MKFNCKELAEYSNGEATIEGRLHHKRITGFSQSGFKEKWYKLRANILFYFNTTETGKTYDKKPAGAFVLENAIVQYEMNAEAPFAFSVIFNDDLDKKHLFAGRTEENITQWVNLLKQASYEFWRSQLMMLQSQLCRLTGKDPLLMYPRNEGSTTTTTTTTTNTTATCSDYNTEAYQKSKKSPSSTFRSFVAPYEEKTPGKANQVPKDNLLSLPNQTVVSKVDLISSEIKNIQIDPPPTPPRRRGRAHKLKTDNSNNNNNNTNNNNSSPNLIEL